MKTKFFLSALLGCTWLAFSVTASAQGNGNSSTTERFNASFNLTPTLDGPPGARGNGRIKSQTKNGERTSTLFLQTRGLEAGDYSVSGVLSSDGSTVTLIEQFTVDAAGNHKTRSRDKMILASDLDVADVIELVVSNSDGVAVLQGDLASNHSSATLDAKVPVVGGDAAPEATGTARLKSSVRNGHRKDSFTMSTSGVPANSVLTVNVDGTDTGTVKSNQQGKVLVKKLPAELTEVGSVSLVDENGGQVARAEF